MWSKIVEISKKANLYGIHLPTITDPKTGKGSVSLTLVFVSFNFCLLSMIGKWAGFMGGIDISQALNLFTICSGLYWGRRFQDKYKSKTDTNT